MGQAEKAIVKVWNANAALGSLQAFVQDISVPAQWFLHGYAKSPDKYF